VSTVQHPQVNPDPTSGTYVSSRTTDDLAQRNKALIELLNSWESEGDEQEQRETLNVIREALGTRRVASSRAQFP
jgi:hypothetical protein